MSYFLALLFQVWFDLWNRHSFDEIMCFAVVVTDPSTILEYCYFAEKNCE